MLKNYFAPRRSTIPGHAAGLFSSLGEPLACVPPCRWRTPRSPARPMIWSFFIGHGARRHPSVVAGRFFTPSEERIHALNSNSFPKKRKERRRGEHVTTG